MKVESQDLDDRQVQITVEVPDQRLQAALRSAARRLSQQTRIPGFRPGKAPYEVVARQLGPDLVLEEALDSIGQEIYRSAIETAQLEPYAPGSLDEVVSREPLILRYTVPLSPEVDLGSYTDIRIEYEEPTVADEAVEEVMEDLRQGQALIEPVDRAAELSDVVVVNVHGELLDTGEGEEADLLEQRGVSVLVDEETDWPFPGISQSLVGLEADDEIIVDHQFSEEYPNKQLRGRQARFRIKCTEVKSRLVPDWSDELARSLGEFEDLLNLRIKVRRQLQKQTEQRAESEYAQKVVEEAVRRAGVVYPPVLLERELEDLTAELEARLERQNLTLEDYLKIEQKTEVQLREEMEPQARERLKRGLVLGKMVEVEELEVDDADIDAELDRMVESLGDEADELRKVLNTEVNRRHIAVDALTQKAVDRLVEIARADSEPTEAGKQRSAALGEGDAAEQAAEITGQE